jgi:hypothetical protein
MSLTSPLVVDDASGDDVTFNRIGSDLSSAIFVDVTSTQAEKRSIRVAHTSTGKGAAVVDRHLVSYQTVVPATPAPAALTINFTIAGDRNVAITSQMVYDGVANLIDFISAGGLATLTTTTIDALLRSET